VNGIKSCLGPVVSLSHATKSYRLNRPLQVLVENCGKLNHFLKNTTRIWIIRTIRPRSNAALHEPSRMLMRETKGKKRFFSFAFRLMWSTAFDRALNVTMNGSHVQYFWENNIIFSNFQRSLRPWSNVVLHKSPTKLNQFGSCEVRRLTQLSSTGFIWSGWGVLHAWPAVNNAWRPTLGQTTIFAWVEQDA